MNRFGPVFAIAYQSILILEAIGSESAERGVSALDEVARLRYEGGFVLDPVLTHSVVACFSCQRRDLEAAQAHAAEALRAAAAMGVPYAEWVARLAEAHVLFESRRHADGDRALARAMALGRANGYVNSHVWIPAIMARLCARALETGIEVEYARDLVRRRRLVPVPPPLDVDAWPWAVKIRALASFTVAVDDQPLARTGKVPRKPLGLLEMLVSRGPSPVREQVLMDALWPDADGDAARRALTTALFRLRRLLGRESAVIRRDAQIGLDPAVCWSDVWAIERLLDRAEAALAASGAASHELARLIERAAMLYPLSSAGEQEEGWIAARAARIRRRLASLLTRAAPSEAAETLRSALGLHDGADGSGGTGSA